MFTVLCTLLLISTLLIFLIIQKYRLNKTNHTNIATVNKVQVTQQVTHFESDISQNQTKAIMEANNHIIANEFQQNQNDLHNLTKGNIKPSEFKTNNGDQIEGESCPNIMNTDGIVTAHEFNENQKDLYNLTKGNIKSDDFITNDLRV